MKKITLLFVAMFAIGFASCKKNRVCTCAIETPSGIIVTETTMYAVKKREGRDNCIGSQTITKTASTSTASNKTTCNLK